MQRFTKLHLALENLHLNLDSFSNHSTISFENYAIGSTGLYYPSPYYLSMEDEDKDTESFIRKVIKQIVEFLKKFWAKLVELAKTFKEFLMKAGGKTKEVLKRFLNGTFLGRRLFGNLKEKVHEEANKPVPDLVTASKYANQASELVGQKAPNFETVQSTKVFVDSLDEKAIQLNNVARLLNNLQLEVSEGDYTLFHPDTHYKLFDLNILKYLNEINNEYYRYTEFCKSQLSVEAILIHLDDISKTMTNYSAKELERVLCRKLVEPFFEYTHLKSVDQNLTNKVRLNAKFINNQAKRDVYTKSTTPTMGLTKFVKDYLENLIDVKADSLPKRPEGVSVSLKEVQLFTKAIIETQNIVEKNHIHLFDSSGKQHAEGFMLDEQGALKMIQDMKVPKDINRKALVKILINITKECNTLINKAHTHWLTIANTVTKYTTEMMFAVNRMKVTLP